MQDEILRSQYFLLPSSSSLSLLPKGQQTTAPLARQYWTKGGHMIVVQKGPGLKSGGLGWNACSVTYSTFPAHMHLNGGKFQYVHLLQRRRERQAITETATCHSAQKANVPRAWQGRLKPATPSGISKYKSTTLAGTPLEKLLSSNSGGQIGRPQLLVGVTRVIFQGNLDYT